MSKTRKKSKKIKSWIELIIKAVAAIAALIASIAQLIQALNWQDGGEKSPPSKNSITQIIDIIYMKKITFYDIFFLAALFIAIAGDWNKYVCIILGAASVMELTDVICKMVRMMRDGRK